VSTSPCELLAELSLEDDAHPYSSKVNNSNSHFRLDIFSVVNVVMFIMMLSPRLFSCFFIVFIFGLVPSNPCKQAIALT
jgi:hypothetical protein